MLSAGEREHLRQMPLFASLDEDTLARVGAMTAVRHYDRGEVIAVEGERGASLRYVRTGLVKLATAAADGHDRTTIYAIRRGVVTRLLSERPAFAQTALQALAADTREIITLAKDLALYHVNERVARLLLDQERCTCERCRNHNMTQQEMAAIVGAAREMVGRTLHEF
jgi:CRP/FNR family transcriptional regulator, cyclic AMP receptor protein